jgi:NAD(P)-dependent dehydrogenase (short-subunit alcohol dehydrogenase family)
MGVAGLDCYTAANDGIAVITRSMAVRPSEGAMSSRQQPLMVDRVRSRLEARNPRVKKIAEAHLLGLIQPDDIPTMAVFLASDESRMITGRVHPVDRITLSQRARDYAQSGQRMIATYSQVSSVAPLR